MNVQSSKHWTRRLPLRVRAIAGLLMMTVGLLPIVLVISIYAGLYAGFREAVNQCPEYKRVFRKLFIALRTGKEQ